MKCNNCGKENHDGNLFCSACGNKLEPVVKDTAEEKETIKCGKCGAENPRDNRFCSACGNSLVSETQADSVHKPAEEVKADIQKPFVVKEPMKPKHGVEVPSSFPMENQMQKMYIIPAVVAIFFLIRGIAVTGFLSGLVAGAFFGAAVFLVMDMTVCRAKITAMERTEYYFPGRIYDLDVIYAAIKKEFLQKGFEINRNKVLGDSIDFIKDKYRYSLRLNKDNGTFTIGIYKTLDGQLSLKGSRLWFRLYAKSLINVPIIAYAVQEDMKKLNAMGDDELNSIAQTADEMKGEFKTSLANEAKGAAFKFIKFYAVIGVILFVAVAAIVGMMGNDYIDTVKNGHPFSYPDTTYGEAFDDFFSHPEWEYFVSDDGRNIVEFNGGAMYMDSAIDVTIQFVVDDDEDTFSVEYVGFNDVPQNEFMKAGLMMAVFEDD